MIIEMPGVLAGRLLLGLLQLAMSHTELAPAAWQPAPVPACTCARTMSHTLREIDLPLVKSSPMEQRLLANKY